MAEYVTYLVDTENVASSGFVGLESLPKSAKIYYFYSMRSYRPSYPEIESLRNLQCKVEFVDSAKSGTNALDFQMITFLGYLIGKSKSHGKHKYIIITNDTGFDAAIEFWTSRGELVSRQDTIGNYEPIKDEDTDEIIENDDIHLEHAFQQLNSVNKRKLNYNKVVSLSQLKLQKDRYSLILSSLYKSNTQNEFNEKIKNIPNSQINDKTKQRIYSIVGDDFKSFRKHFHVGKE